MILSNSLLLNDLVITSTIPLDMLLFTFVLNFLQAIFIWQIFY